MANKVDINMIPKTIAVFGATGFLGGHLMSTLRCVCPNSRLLAISRTGNKCSSRNFFQLDMQNLGSLERFLAMEKPDLIFHLAGAINCRDWSILYDQNVKTTMNILEAVSKTHIACRIVVPGSAAEYGEVSPDGLPVMEEHPLDPLFPYGLSKVWQTSAARYFASQGSNVVIGRIFNVIGPGMANYLSMGSFVSQIQRIILKEIPPTLFVGDISVKRDFLDVFDVCSGLIKLALYGKRGCTYNLCSGHSYVISDLLDRFIRYCGIEVEVMVDQSKIRYRPVDNIFGSNEKAKRDTGWEPTITIQKSIEKICGELLHE